MTRINSILDDLSETIWQALVFELRFPNLTCIWTMPGKKDSNDKRTSSAQNTARSTERASLQATGYVQEDALVIETKVGQII
jgi:hypothetical protein